MPLWQSMQVALPVSRYFEWMSAARCVCLVRSIATAEWQLRHSRLSFALRRLHSWWASSRRLSRNFSRVLKVRAEGPSQVVIDAAGLGKCGVRVGGDLVKTGG